jgi:hypothetical protein
VKALVIIVALILVGCGSDDPLRPQEKIIGTWHGPFETQSVSGTANYVIAEDGTFTIVTTVNGVGIFIVGTWALNGDRFIVIAQGLNFSANIAIQKNQILLAYNDGTGQTWVRVDE